MDTQHLHSIDLAGVLGCLAGNTIRRNSRNASGRTTGPRNRGEKRRRGGGTSPTPLPVWLGPARHATTDPTPIVASSEEILGRAIKDIGRRDDVVVATKAYGRMRPGPNGGGLSRKAIMREIDDSLRRLGTDYVDLYQIHRRDHGTPIEETPEALHDIVKAGKARYISASSIHA